MDGMGGEWITGERERCVERLIMIGLIKYTMEKVI